MSHRPVASRRVVHLIAWPVGLLAFFLGAIGWYISGRIESEGLRVPPDPAAPRCDDAVVVASSDSAVTLRPVGDDSSRVRRGSEWGLRWRDGWGRVGHVLATSSDGVTRAYLPIGGRPGPGAPVDITAELDRSDPMRAWGHPFQMVMIPTELGDAPAWFVPGTSDTWWIFVHGKGADRTQALSTLNLYADRGLPCLIISYRNDPGAPASPDGCYRYGLTEWKDLESACRYALARGAHGFILAGDSMGGGIVLAFLEKSPLAARVRGAILDAPVVDFASTIDLGIREARLPLLGLPMPPLTGLLARNLATLRFGVSWRSYDWLRAAGRLRTPLLVFHGDADDVVPFQGSAQLASARPDLVTFEPVRAARHIESWELDRSRYGSLVGSFLDRSR